jgi:hypothetical protein
MSNTQSLKIVDIKRKPPGTEMISGCADRVFTAWLRGTPERRLAEVWDRRRVEIESIVREKAQERIWPTPGAAKRAA